MKHLPPLIALLAAASAAAAAPDRWDLSELYASTTAWQASADSLAPQLKPNALCARGAPNARAWAGCLTPFAAAAQQLNALDHYAMLSKAIGENLAELPMMEARRNQLTAALDDWRWTLQWAWSQRPAAQRDGWLREPVLAG